MGILREDVRLIYNWLAERRKAGDGGSCVREELLSKLTKAFTEFWGDEAYTRALKTIDPRMWFIHGAGNGHAVIGMLKELRKLYFDMLAGLPLPSSVEECDTNT